MSRDTNLIALTNVTMLYQNLGTPYQNKDKQGKPKYTISIILDKERPEVKELDRLLDLSTKEAFGPDRDSIVRAHKENKQKTNGHPFYVWGPCAFDQAEDPSNLRGRIIPRNVLEKAIAAREGYYKPWDQYYRLNTRTGLQAPPTVVDPYKKPLIGANGKVLKCGDPDLDKVFTGGCVVSVVGSFLSQKTSNPYTWFVPRIVQYVGEGCPIEFETTTPEELLEMLPGAQAPTGGTTLSVHDEL